MRSVMPTAIGIDLGTTYSCVAYMKSATKVEVVPNQYGNKITPSVVYFGAEFKAVGEEAQTKRGEDPKNTVFQIKRFMGRSAAEVTAKGKQYPFEVLANRKGEAAIRIKPIGEDTSTTLCPQQISSFILSYMKGIASTRLAGDVTDAVITVPANFNNAQREATKLAGNMAGLNVLRIINEPTAAALAYAFLKKSEEKRVVLVYDLGGGTFDVSIVRSNGNGGDVLATAGDMNLGGEDFDQRLYDHVTAEFKTKGLSISLHEQFEVYKSCEAAKRSLSCCQEATASFFQDGKTHTCKITRDTFEELCVDLFEKTIECVEDAISQAGVSKEGIDDIVLVGGSSRIPKVQQLLHEAFGDRKLKFDIPPDHAVAHGAAILAASLSSEADELNTSLRGRIKLADVLPFSLGVLTAYDRFSRILKRNTQYPATARRGYVNGSDDQEHFGFMILEGEDAFASRNTLLAKCGMNVAPKKAGEHKMEVTFSVDEDGILSVHVLNSETNEVVQTKVQTTTLSDAERMAMIGDARKEEENERKRKAQYEARTEFADAMHRMKRSIHEPAMTAIKAAIQAIIDREDGWANQNTDASNDEFTSRAWAIRKEFNNLKRSFNIE